MIWQRKTLGEVTNLKRGFDLPAHSRAKGPFPLYSSSGLTGNNNVPAVSGPCVITGRYGTIGDVFYSDGACWPLNTTLYTTEFKGNNPKFIYYLLKTIPWSRYTTASAVPGINRNHINLCPVFVPEIRTQRAIVNILETLDEKIALNNQINGYLLEHTRAYFSRWINHANGKSCRIDEIAQLNPSTYSLQEKWPHVQYLDTGSITCGCIEGFQQINLLTDDLPSRARRKVQAKDIVYSTVRPNQKHYGILLAPDSDVLVSTGFTVIRLNDTSVFPELLYLFLTQDKLTMSLQQIAEQSTSAYPSIKADDIGSLEIPMPTNLEANSLHEILEPVFSLIATNQKENHRLEMLRDALLPKLMSGEIDVSRVEVPTRPNSHLSGC